MKEQNLTLEEMKALPLDEQKKIIARISAARKKGKTCLPIDNTEVLTDSGWKYFKDILLTDKVLSLNTTTNLMEFCEIRNRVFYEDQPITVLENHSIKLESTADHRWYVERTTGRDKTRRKIYEYRATEDLNKACNIIVSAPYEAGKSSVTVEQAKILGWLLSDGYFDVSDFVGAPSQGVDGWRVGVRMSIAQSPKKYFDEIKTLLDGYGMSYTSYFDKTSGVGKFQIDQSDARKFLLDIGLPLKYKHDIDYTTWMLGLSKEALEGFYDAFWKADGLTTKAGETYASKVIYQNGGNVADAVHLCSYLLGYTVLNTTSNGYGTIRKQNRSTITMQKMVKSNTGSKDVFCLTTGNGNFVIRQNSFITLTGNCNYASVYNAGAAKIAQAAGVSEDEGKILHAAYWELNWSVKAIAEEQVIILDKKGSKWLVNPINGFCYSLRKESDRFSTLAQGTGSFFFDMWVDNILEEQQRRWKKKTLTASFHDENILVIRDSEKFKAQIKEIIQDSIDKVNETYKLRRKLGCETQFGQRYAEIH